METCFYFQRQKPRKLPPSRPCRKHQRPVGLCLCRSRSDRGCRWGKACPRATATGRALPPSLGSGPAPGLTGAQGGSGDAQACLALQITSLPPGAFCFLKQKNRILSGFLHSSEPCSPRNRERESREPSSPPTGSGRMSRRLASPARPFLAGDHGFPPPPLCCFACFAFSEDKATQQSLAPSFSGEPHLLLPTSHHTYPTPTQAAFPCLSCWPKGK